MSFKFNDKIVTDGLVFCVDPANLNSYISGSSIIYDIAKTTSKGIISPGGTFNNGNGGSILLSNSISSTGQYISGSDDSNLLNVGANGNVTIDMFINPVDSSINGPLFSYGNFTGGSFISYGIGISQTSILVSSGGTSISSGNGTIFSNQWINITVVFSTNTPPSYYKNGVFKINSPLLTTSTSYSNNWYIGKYFPTATSAFNGKIGVTKIYNRALSAAEIQQNFNAVRKRYNL